ncbi:MAG: sulfite exporter TauE/SafE family protein [Chloroflexota bacterium]
MLPDYPTTFWIAAVTAVLIVGIAKAGFGGGIGFVATPLIALTISVADAAALLLPILIIIDLLSIRHYRGIYDRASLKLLLPSAVVGITLGALFFNALRDNDDMLRRALGLLAVLFVVYQVGRTAIMGALEGRRPGRPVGIFLGVLSGFGSTLAHAGGPPATMYLLPQKLPRQVFAGTAVWFFMAVNHGRQPDQAHTLRGARPAAPGQSDHHPAPGPGRLRRRTPGHLPQPELRPGMVQPHYLSVSIPHGPAAPYRRRADADAAGMRQLAGGRAAE